MQTKKRPRRALFLGVLGHCSTHASAFGRGKGLVLNRREVVDLCDALRT